MKKNSTSLIVALAASTLLFSAGSALAVGHSHGLKIGKKGETTFSQETIVGNITLKPGNYTFQHKVVGTNHFMSFQRVSEGTIYNHFGEGFREGNPILVKCRIEPLNQKVSDMQIDSVVSGGVQHISSIEIPGENVAHLF